MLVVEDKVEVSGLVPPPTVKHSARDTPKNEGGPSADAKLV